MGLMFGFCVFYMVIFIIFVLIFWGGDGIGGIGELVLIGKFLFESFL